jgi:hypothetical protein
LKKSKGNPPKPAHLLRIASLQVSAASGCVIAGDVAYVVADDDVRLHGYALDGTPRSVTPLFDQLLPSGPPHRKRTKPDLEALTALPDGTLLALGSGSSDRRRRAVVVSPAFGTTTILDAAPLFSALEREFSQLNIEGCAVHEGHLVLGQRGNGSRRENALIRLKLSSALLSPDSVVSIQPLELGSLQGVPLSITDLAVGPGGVLHFTAAAEDTADPYHDGACAGSVVGAFAAGTAQVQWTALLSESHKIEGLAHHRGEDWYLVADADDPSVAAPLFRMRMGSGGV